ncbi:MAG: hypothetical protein V1826_01905, partial [bacterium]
WLPESLLRKYNTLTKASSRSIVSRSGLQTCDNFRFLRLSWEVPVAERCTLDSWPRLTKGGDYQPFWSDTPLVIYWKHNGEEIKAFIDGLYGQWSKQIPSVDLYGTPGATYTERTTSAISLRVLAAACLFDKKGPFIGFANGSLDKSLILQFIGLSYTTPVKALIESSIGLRDATTSGSPARDYLPSLIERLCFPHFTEDEAQRIESASRICVMRHIAIESAHETSSLWSAAFSWSAYESISGLAQNEARVFRRHLSGVYQAFSEVEELSRSMFDISQDNASSLQEILGESVFQFENSDFGIDPDTLVQLANMNIDQLVDHVAGSHGRTIATLKQAFVGDRTVELLSVYFQRHPLSILKKLEDCKIVTNADSLIATESLISFSFGVIYGRWDIRFVIGERQPPELPDPFAPLPVCPPGMLQNTDGLPAEPKDVPADYPLRIAWPGILVDDENHPEDIVARIREAIEAIWKERADAIEQEACELLGVKALRDYFRRPASFFADHLKRYSKSRRQAPIYWPLSTAKGSYTLWIYYHRLTDQTLHTALADFIDPKLKVVRAEISALRETTTHRARLEELLDLEKELADFHAEIERIIKLPWEPNLNDGVIITASPLWKLFRLPKWQKDLKACWEKLEKGEYDWAYLAYSIWPKRVEEVCMKDRSIAIAHNLERLCQVTPSKPKAKRGRKAAVADGERIL